MTTTYPAAFACASREGHSAQVSAGLIRTPMEAGNTRQRRAYRGLPHMISLVFLIEQKAYADWLAWCNVNAWDDWVSMRLPGLAAGRAGTDTTPILVRFCSDLQAELVPIHRRWFWRAHVSAEWMPTSAQLAPPAWGAWIVGGTPSTPSPDWMVGGQPGAPSTVFITPGTPAAPVVPA